MASSSPPPKASPEERLVTSLIALMEAGTTPWRRPWEDNGGGHHLNLISGRRYRGANPILLTFGLHILMAQRPAVCPHGAALPYWCGFAEAKAFGLFPRKGSKAVHVLRPQVTRRGESMPDENNSEGGVDGGGEVEGDGSSQGGERVWIRYRPLPVFNAADLEGKALAGLIAARRAAEGSARRPEPERLAAADAVLRAWPVPVSHGGACACYLPQVDRIQLPDRSAFHSASALYATWAHEVIHSTGHPTRLKRDLSGAMAGRAPSRRAYAREELVAELGAVLLGDRLEIGSDVCNHAAYLGGWIALLQESPQLLLQVLREARLAADLIAPESDLGIHHLQDPSHHGHAAMEGIHAGVRRG
jgi:antirestriction protein ArdC